MFIPSFNDFQINLPQADMSDMLVHVGSSHRFKRANLKKYMNHREPGYTKRTPMMMRPTITDATMRAMPLRDAINLPIKQAKVAGGKTNLLGAYPKSGNARNQPSGLASLAEYAPREIMPIADNFFPAMNTTLV